MAKRKYEEGERRAFTLKKNFQEHDGIRIVFSQLNQDQFKKFKKRIEAAKDEAEKDRLWGWLVRKVVIRWPFSQPITAEGYNALGAVDSLRVKKALLHCVEELGEALKWMSANSG